MQQQVPTPSVLHSYSSLSEVNRNKFTRISIAWAKNVESAVSVRVKIVNKMSPWMINLFAFDCVSW